MTGEKGKEEAASSEEAGEAAGKVEWIPLNKEVRGVHVSPPVSRLLDDRTDARPCGGLLDLYVSCVRTYNIELCDDEKFLYRKCMRDFLQERR